MRRDDKREGERIKYTLSDVRIGRKILLHIFFSS